MLGVLKFALIFFYVYSTVYGQVVSHVRVINHEDYFVELVQATMNEVEEGGWCNLKIPDFTQQIDQTIYGWQIKGTVSYKNGFLVSIYKMNLQNSSVQQIWTHDTYTNTSAVNVRGTLRIYEVAIGYDVEFTMEGRDTEHYTGIFTYERIDFVMAIQKTFPEQSLEAFGSCNNLASSGRKINFLPRTNVTEVLQRNFVASTTMSGVNVWANDIFRPIMLKLVTTTLQFPEMCYNCSA